MVREALEQGILRSQLRRFSSECGVGSVDSDNLLVDRVLAELDRQIGGLVLLRKRAQSQGAPGRREEPEPPQQATNTGTEPQIYSGRIIGPAGPLGRWPFLLRRDGVEVDQRSLHGSSSNAYRDGAWVSGTNGEFRFENVPPAGYAVEAVVPSGRLVVNGARPPDGVGESGKRVATPRRQGGADGDADGQDWFRPPRVDDDGEYFWAGEVGTAE
jgi:hypothetical protein